MQNLNPERFTAPKSYNSNTEDARMGFAMRSELATRSVSAPQIIRPLGANIAQMMRYSQQRDDRIRNQILWRDAIRVPGIMMFDFEPIIAPQSGTTGRQIVADIWRTIWSAVSQYYAPADTIQPADMAMRALAEMQLSLWVEYARKAFDVLKLVDNADNDYVTAKVFYTAMGFDEANFDDDFDKWVSLRLKFNRDVIGKINGKNWSIRNVFPGEDRWKALTMEWFKDESIDSAYVQIYGFKPRSFYMFEETQPDPDKPKFVFNLTRMEPPTSLANLIDMLKTLTTHLYYSTSSILVNNVLLQFKQRNNNNVTNVEIDYVNEEEYEEERPIKFTYDWNMLVAIHNATIMYGLRTSTIDQNPETGNLVQVVAFDESAYSWKWFTTPKIVNLPNFNASDEEFINAVQWTIAAGPDDYVVAGEITPEILGTDVLVDCRIYRYDRRNDAITSTPLYQFTESRPGDASYYPAGYYIGSRDQLYAVVDATTFNMHPLCYITRQDDPTDTTAPFFIERVLGELDCVYLATPERLRALKEQFVLNFWGFPFKQASNGSYDLPNHQTTTVVSENGTVSVNSGSGKTEYKPSEK